LKGQKILHYKSIIVLEHEHYYPKFGFAPATTLHISDPFDVLVNVFMGIELFIDGLQGISATVIYLKVFEAA